MYASELKKAARIASSEAEQAQEAGKHQAMSAVGASKRAAKPRFRPLAEVDPERQAAQEDMERRIIELGNPYEGLDRHPERLKEIDELMNKLADAAIEDTKARLYRHRMRFMMLFATGCELAAIVPYRPAHP